MVAMPVLAAFTLHQRTAPLDSRERLLEVVAAWRGLTDRFVLATCHRVEVYATFQPSEPSDWLAREIASPSVRAGVSCFIGVDAVRHLFEVAAGLDSAVQGESQIRSQVRAVIAHEDALDHRLRRLLERALHVARSLRRETGLGRVNRSVGSLAVDEIEALLVEPSQASVMVIGAGEMGRLAVRALRRKVARVIVANRDRARAEAVAQSAGASAISLDEVPGLLEGVDGVVSAADTRGALLTAASLAPRLALRRLTLVDIAVPRSVGAEARSLPGLVYRSVDDLAQSRTLSREDLGRALQKCAIEAERFARETSERAAIDAIRDVRAYGDAVRRRQLERALRRLGHLSPRDRRIVEGLSSGVVNSLLHELTIALKKKPDLSEQAHALFGIGRDPR